MSILKNASVLLLLTLLFQEDGEGEALRNLAAATDADTATEEELRALYDALIAGLSRWLLHVSFGNWNGLGNRLVFAV
jgi:hypothetical protein